MKKLSAMVVAPLVLLLAGCTRIVGTGDKVGSVIKVSNEGTFSKTNEIEIVRGGMNGGSGGFSTTPLLATINDPGILAKANDALDKQYEVKVKYVDYFECTPWVSDSPGCRFITSIEPLKPR